MIWPFFLPLWFVFFGAICAVMLAAKGYEWWLGVLLGTFGPFGILIAALIKPSAAGAVPPPAAGSRWEKDPTGRHELRLWDGVQWTDNVSDRGIAGVDPA